jgi:hypothetical protein
MFWQAVGKLEIVKFNEQQGGRGRGLMNNVTFW